VFIIWRAKQSVSPDKAMIAFLFMLQLILFIPALVYYAMIGLTITWALPHITLQFWVLHSLLQVALVGVIGLLFLSFWYLWRTLHTRKASKLSSPAG